MTNTTNTTRRHPDAATAERLINRTLQDSVTQRLLIALDKRLQQEWIDAGGDGNQEAPDATL